ncbi:MAG: cysteine desulfurase [Atopobiaceae bacterium]|nr:cysteine desulfurase [Atopobiaceae bacterium]
MAERRLYLDCAASAPACKEALEAERAYEQSPYAGANPNSLHTMGRLAARALDGARSDLARCLGGGFRPSDVTFTSGGTESNNLALWGLAEGARARDRRRTRVVLSSIEHDSILDVAPSLRDRGFEVSFAPASREGVVTSEAVEALLGADVALVSVMAANNETGVVQPIEAIATACHKSGALVHTDAVQAFGRIPLTLSGVDAVSIAAHKIGGPVGVGALAVRSRTPLRPQSFGGGQEQGRRAGTQDVRGALAFAAAARTCAGHLEERLVTVSTLAQGLQDALCAPGTGIHATVSIPYGKGRLPGLVSLLVEGIDSETLVLKLDEAGYEVSAGSACSSGSLDPSHVLLAMGIPRNEAFNSLRVSFDERVTRNDLDGFAQALLGLAEKRK